MPISAARIMAVLWQQACRGSQLHCQCTASPAGPHSSFCSAGDWQYTLQVVELSLSDMTRPNGSGFRALVSAVCRPTLIFHDFMRGSSNVC